MRDRLADWCLFKHLAHMIHSRESRRGWNQRLVWEPIDVRLYPIDFELLHYSAGVRLCVMGGREHIRTEAVQDAFVVSFQRIFFIVDFEATSKEVLKVPSNAFRYV